MFEFFLNPWTMMAGGALISSPIIIHLINRMRFRRVRWAAMEFLLKSQKRNRRKLIIEQLLLLLLRILAVLLVAFLLARFLGFNPLAAEEARATLHVVVLDDTPSMGDAWRQDGQRTDAYEQAKRQIAESIARTVSRANSAQELQVVRLSDLDNPRRFERVNAASVEELRSHLRDTRPTPVHVPLLKGLEKAQSILVGRADMARTLHVVSDFRSADWGGPDQENLRAKFEELQKANVTVHLIDVAHPERRETTRVPLYNDNLGIVDLRPDSRVVARYQPVEFAVDVANFSNSERKNVRVAVKLNGLDRPEASVNLASLPPNQVTSARFTIASVDRIGTEQNPLERFNLVSASLETQESGLAVDDTRYAFVEVRERVPILIVEGDSSRRGTKAADGYYLQTLFRDTLSGYEVVVSGPAELEAPNLQQYSSVLLANVRELPDKAVANLREYARSGGGVAFFLGPLARPEFYNKLYADGQGIFPVPLADEPTEPLTDEQRARRGRFSQMQMFPRDEQHPALERLYYDAQGHPIDREQYNKLLRFAGIERHWPVPRLKWNYTEGKVQELITLPNHRPMRTYEGPAKALLDRLPLEDPKYAKFKDVLTRYRDEVRVIAASGQPLFTLSNALETMLTDSGDAKDPARPNLQEFWQSPEVAPLRRDFRRLLETVRYGDPLYVARQYGAGRVVAFLTTANADWNDLSGLGMLYYPNLMMEMQKYLASAGTDVNRAVGTPLELALDPAVYTPKVRRALLAEHAGAGISGPAGHPRNAPSSITDQGEQVLEVRDGQLRLSLDRTREPGVYLFELTTQDPANPSRTAPEYKAFAFNVDTAREGNLRRADRDDLLKIAGGAQLHTAGEDWSEVLNPRRRDYSELPWIFLLLLLVLVAEQAMAVRLSYHARAAEAGAARA
ncbi:MAG TPA: BatA domain-containing protein [Gemmataceae bacterium]